MAEVSKDGTVGSTAVAVFTVPANQVLIIASLSVKDESGAANSVDIYLDNGGAAAATTNRLERLELEANEPASVGEAQGKRIAQGGKLYVKGSGGANTLNWFLSGRTVVQTTNAEDVG